MAKVVGLVLEKLGLGEAEDTSYTDREIDTWFGGSRYMGTNSRAVPENAEEIGWKAVFGDDAFWKHFEFEVPRVAKRHGKL